MKNQSITRLVGKINYKTFRQALGLTSIMLFLCVSPIFAKMAYSQSVKFNLNLKNTTIEQVFEEIRNQSEFEFFYNNDQVNTNAKVDVTVKNASIEQVLDAVLKNQYDYKIADRYILVSKNQNAARETGMRDVQQQSNVVTGVITDNNNEPLIGATVAVKGSTRGTMTDVDGKYSIQVNPGETLVISYLGFQAVERAVKADEKTVNLKMAANAQNLNEVVVVGYGVQKKTNLTGSVSQVKMEQVLGNRPVTNASTALQGTIPGLQITGGSTPGTAKTINIRGLNSITPGSNALVLVDNVPGDLDLLNPEDIETVSVLKDAASAAIYGARGAFGVILVTTKQAKKNSKLTINYNNNFAYQNPINQPRQASVENTLRTYIDWDNDGKFYAQGQNLQKWLGYVQEYNKDANAFLAKHPGAYFVNGRFVPAQNDNGDPVPMYYYLTDNKPNSGIFDKYGFQQTHDVSALGGSDKITYRMALGYANQDGPLKTDKDSYNRINATSFIKGDITNWLSQSLDIKYTKSDRSYVEDGNVFIITAPSFFPTGSMPYANDLNGRAYPTNSPENFLLLANPSKWLTSNTRILSQTSIHPLNGLEAILEYTYNNRYVDYKRYTNDAEMIMMEQALMRMSTTPTYYNTKTTNILNSLNAYVTYEKQFNENHYFKVMGGYNQETSDYESLAVNRTDMINPSLPSFSSATGTTKATDDYTQYAIRSGFFRVNYKFKDKYLLEANGRYDGSSKFPTETRFGFFPSISAGWQLGRENFMKWSEKWLNEMKARVSWGQLGNQSGVAAYGYTPTMDPVLSPWIVGGIQPTTLKAPGLVRSNYTWEIVETTDFGMDLAFLKNRLTAVFDWYQRDTKGMLAPGSELPSVVGTTAPMQNVADLRTKGWEVSMQWRDRINDWRYGFGFNLYDAQTKITKYDNKAGLFYDSNSNTNYRVGMSPNEIWGYVTDGYYTIDDFENKDTWKLKPGVPDIQGYTGLLRPGDIKFKDLPDKDGKLDGIINTGENTVNNPGDRQIIGNSSLRLQYGLNGNLGWKDFDFSFYAMGVGKRDAWIGNGMMFGPANGQHWVGVYENQLDYWKPKDIANGDYTASTPDAYYPRIYGENRASGSNYRTQTKYLSNAAYFRLKNITLSYNVPNKLLQKVGLMSGKVFFSGENIFTKSHLIDGIDPENLGWGYPFYASWSFGISVSLK